MTPARIDGDSDDKEENVNEEYTPNHISDYARPAKLKKQRTSFKQRQQYIDQHHAHDAGLRLSGNTIAEELPYEVVCDDHFVGCYLKWLADAGTYLRTEKLLGHASCLGYASSFSEFFTNKYRTRPTPLPLTKDKWSRKILLITLIRANC